LISRTTTEFWAHFYGLPLAVQKLATEKYRLWRQDPAHSSLRFKALRNREGIWSARISRSYRALAYREDDKVTWFWIGTHSEYDQMIS
jgi:hypothetical protein